jgi:hypothetical protein
MAQENYGRERVLHQIPLEAFATFLRPCFGILILLSLSQLSQLCASSDGKRQRARPQHHAASHHDIDLPHCLWCAMSLTLRPSRSLPGHVSVHFVPCCSFCVSMRMADATGHLARYWPLVCSRTSSSLARDCCLSPFLFSCSRNVC